MKKKLQALLFFFSFFFANAATAQTTRYVKPSSSGSGNGSSWANASSDLQAMINVSSSGDRIFVATGTYKPNRKANATATITPNDRDNAFVLKSGVKIYGGFDPANGIDDLTDKRISPSVNTGSILSGDFNNDDVVSGSGSTLTITNNSENARHIVISAGDVGTALLDGFTITGGNANTDGSLTVNSTEIYSGAGGGVFNAASSPLFRNVVICKNATASNGGGIANYNAAKPVFVNVLIFKNLSVIRAGGVFNVNVSSPVFRNTVIALNRANSGAGVYSLDNYPVGYSTPAFYNSVIYGNSSGLDAFNQPYNILVYTANNSLIQGISTTSNGNINGNTDPKFADADNNDYTLATGSPLIDNGNNTYVTEAIDLAGNARIRNNTVDIGVYEVQSGNTVKLSPTLSDFVNITKTYGDADFTLTAPTSNSNGTFSYSSSDENVALISGSTVTIVGAGAAVITATQSATDNYNSGSTSLTLTVSKSAQTITFTELDVKTTASPDFVLTASASSNLPVSYSSSNTTVAEVYEDSGVWKVNIKGEGITNIVASQNGNSNYLAATDVIRQLTVVGTPLSVELTNFTAKIRDNQVKLEWHTSFEKDNAKFIIYRSGNDKAFIKIGEVPATYNTQSLTYNFVDEQPLNGKNYYKLVQIDNDGTETEMGLKLLTFNVQSVTFNLFPNPTADVVNISFPEDMYSFLQVSDIDGKVLQSVLIQPGEEYKTVYLGNYPVGTYLIRINGYKGSKTSKVLKF